MFVEITRNVHRDFLENDLICQDDADWPGEPEIGEAIAAKL
jgi:hypothetical protein